ncbi:hypothetical protein BGZ95_001823, partial [Linnemannia exigua]
MVLPTELQLAREEAIPQQQRKQLHHEASIAQSRPFGPDTVVQPMTQMNHGR